MSNARAGNEVVAVFDANGARIAIGSRVWLQSVPGSRLPRHLDEAGGTVVGFRGTRVIVDRPGGWAGQKTLKPVNVVLRRGE